MGRPCKIPPAVRAYIAEHVKGVSAEDLADMTNEEFGTSYTAGEIRSYKKKNGLRSGVNFGWRRFKRGVPEYITELTPGRTTKEVARLVNERFGEGTITPKQVLAFKKNHHLHSGLEGKFKKGSVPYIKGKKLEEVLTPEGLERSKTTRYKKGNIPWTRKPIGTISKARDGYLWIKYRESRGNKGRDGWMQLHRYIWQQHNGPIPDGHIVIFLDGNRENCDIRNLAAVSKAEHIEMTRSELRSGDPDLTATGIAVAKLITTTREKKKGAAKSSQ